MAGIKLYLILFTGVLAVSFAAVFVRLAEAPPLVIATGRMTVAAVTLLPVTLVRSRGNLRKLTRRDLSWLLLTSLFLALHFGLWITSLNYTSIASSVVLVTSHPAFVAAVSFFLWGERLGRGAIGGIALALAGVFIINYGGFAFGTQAVIGDGLALAAGFTMGAYLIMGVQLGKRVDILSYLSIVYSISAVILLATTLLAGYRFSGYPPETYLMIVLLGLVPQLIGHSSLNLAVRFIPVTLVAVAILGEPVGATLLGSIILGEMPTASEIAGGLLVLGGIFVVIRLTRYSPASNSGLASSSLIPSISAST